MTKWWIHIQFIWLKWNQSTRDWKEIKVSGLYIIFCAFKMTKMKSVWVKWNMYDWNELKKGLWLKIDPCVVWMNDVLGIETLCQTLKKFVWMTNTVCSFCMYWVYYKFLCSLVYPYFSCVVNAMSILYTWAYVYEHIWIEMH